MARMGRFDYSRMIREALRQVVRLALTEVMEEGLEGDHHFFITFDTSHPEVEMPPVLRDMHPERMTIVLQHVFWDLEVGSEAFSVTLSFDRARRRLTVPYAAIESFVDPGAEFGLRFDLAPPEGEQEPEGEPAVEAPAPSGPAVDGEAASPTPSVVRLEDFRKRER